MTNAKISEIGKAVLRNAELASLIAHGMATQARAFMRGGFIIKVDGKEYTIRAATFSGKENQKKKK